MNTPARAMCSFLFLLLVCLAPILSVPALARDEWSEWQKREDPIFSGQYIASDPTLIREVGLYRMFYTCFAIPKGAFDPDTVRATICEATSTDGLSWTEIPVDGQIKGLVFQGREEAWDQDIEGAFALKWKGNYLLYYSGYRHLDGYPAQGYPAALNVATSEDGVTFERVFDDPILSPTPGGYDNDAVYSPTIVEHNGELVMIYAGHCYTDCDYGYGVTLLAATSQDGLHWTKVSSPVMTGTEAGLEWTRDGVAEPGLVQGPDGRWYLFFTGLVDEERAIGLAVGDSPLGPWDVRPDPLFEPTPGGFDSAGDLAPFVFIEDGTVRMWFLGMNPEEQIVIGYAEATWPLLKAE